MKYKTLADTSADAVVAVHYHNLKDWLKHVSLDTASVELHDYRNPFLQILINDTRYIDLWPAICFSCKCLYVNNLNPVSLSLAMSDFAH